MKSQDILLLLKLVSLEQWGNSLRHQDAAHDRIRKGGHSWQDWEMDEDGPLDRQPTLSPDDVIESVMAEHYSVRGLASSTGVSKSQVSLSLKRCEEVGLVKPDRLTHFPRTNTRALLELIVHGVRYVFPARPGEVTRGIATSLGAPVLKGALMTAGDLLPVWPDARGRTKGVAVAPLYKTVPMAVRRDPRLYALLALTDGIRIGAPRERKLAGDRLASLLREST